MGGRYTRLSSLEMLPVDQLWKGAQMLTQQSISARQMEIAAYKEDLCAWDEPGMQYLRRNYAGLEVELQEYRDVLPGMESALEASMEAAAEAVTAEIAALRAVLGG